MEIQNVVNIRTEARDIFKREQNYNYPNNVIITACNI